MDVREKLIEILKKPIFPQEMVDPIEAVADYLLDSGVTVQEWISVEDRLPNENEYVIVFDEKCQIAKIENGISKKERELMKNGEINAPVEIGWNMSDGYFQLKRSESYRACDEGWNNRVPYCWYVNGGKMKLFGQNVTYWMTLPDPPK